MQAANQTQVCSAVQPWSAWSEYKHHIDFGLSCKRAWCQQITSGGEIKLPNVFRNRSHPHRPPGRNT